ncbi:MAG: NADH:ubiquinone reductase (Na(+)-transporting) subunit A [Bacteroidetes bacterium GWA2_31_9b]|nr:MAG: NADH:ubiquinone reductase (Na(+)-transporting) subunit A [Bacteroidetes bacterium GWA2_31_9b]
MSQVIKIKKGLNINLLGEAEKIIKKADQAEYYAVKPTDFKGIRPKLVVKVGDKVKAGSPLFFDKLQPEILFVSPVSGEITAINRGERRVIQEVIIHSDEKIDYHEFKVSDPKTLTRDEIILILLESGMWPLLRQRPYSVIANPKDTPKSIFISAFDTAPLAPDMDFVVSDDTAMFQKGIDVLSKLTTGTIHLNLNADYPVAEAYNQAKGVLKNYFTGPHPTGNVGVQINKIDPINKGDIIWYTYPQEVIAIGRLFEKGIYDVTKTVAITGSEIIHPKYLKIINGASIKSLLKENVKSGNNRFISGNVLTGTKISNEGFISFYDNQITVIPEGKYFEFFGWALPGIQKYSASRTFLSWLMPGKKYTLDTNLHGGHRAFVMTNEYDKVFPMDIYPVHLIKAILAEDIELMEKLGIYEVDEEDFALCEFVCTSKIDVQSIIRKGLDLTRVEMS